MSPQSSRPAFAPWDERVAGRIISEDEARRRLRVFAGVEEQLAAMLERFAGVIDEPHAQGTLARHARHHAWHGATLREGLGDSPGAGGTDDPAVAAFVEAVAEPGEAGATVEFLAGVYRVLIPRKIAAYTYFVRALGGDAQDSDARWFDFILDDEFDGIRDGELLLQSLLAEPDAVERSARRRADLEARVVSIGGLAGPETLGGSTTTTTKEAAR